MVNSSTPSPVYIHKPTGEIITLEWEQFETLLRGIQCLYRQNEYHPVELRHLRTVRTALEKVRDS